MKVFRQNAVDWQGATREVKRALPLRQVLRLVGWRVRSRGRADCDACQADHSQHGTVSFNDGKGVWHCFRCGRGGNVIDLIMCSHGCDFITALKYFAGSAHIELPTKMTAEEKRRLAEQEAQRQRIGSAGGKLDRREHELRLWYQDLIHRSKQKQDEVRQRLGELYGGAPERWRGEYEGCWG